MSARDLCRLSGLARSSLYRKPKPDSEHARQLRQAIVRAALDHPACGTRRTTHPVRRQKLSVNRKRVQRVMREENLVRRSRRRVPQTTDSKHELRRYENLTGELRPAGPNQLWGSDISYVRLRNRFVYVAVVWDVFSRRVVGWAVGPNLKTGLPPAGTGLDRSFRSGFAVRFEGLCARAAQSRREDLDEPQGPAAGQRSCGKLFQNVENGGSRMQRV